jgi:hypothetical protein
MLPQAARAGVEAQLAWRAAVHARDLERGLGWVSLPDALPVKYPAAPTALGWQFLFASRCLSRDPRSDNVGRHHLHESRVHLAVTTAVRSLGWTKRATCPVTRCGTVSPPTCWRWTTTSAPCRNCSATPTSAPP